MRFFPITTHPLLIFLTLAGGIKLHRSFLSSEKNTETLPMKLRSGLFLSTFDSHIVWQKNIKNAINTLLSLHYESRTRQKTYGSSKIRYKRRNFFAVFFCTHFYPSPAMFSKKEGESDFLFSISSWEITHQKCCIKYEKCRKLVIFFSKTGDSPYIF